MKYSFVFTFVFMDGKPATMVVEGDDKERFLQCLGKGEVYWNERKGEGTWLPVDKIRYFKVARIEHKADDAEGAAPVGGGEVPGADKSDTTKSRRRGSKSVAAYPANSGDVDLFKALNTSEDE